MFANNDTEMVQSDIMDVIRENAFRVNVEGQKYLVLGELLLTAVNITVPTLPINITDVLTTPQPDITIPPNVIHGMKIINILHLPGSYTLLLTYICINLTSRM